MDPHDYYKTPEEIAYNKIKKKLNQKKKKTYGLSLTLKLIFKFYCQ